MAEYEGCYVFTPDEADSVSQRPLKRRKTEPAKAPPDQNTELLFTPLLKGLEKIQSTRTRSEIFEDAWRPKEALLKRIHDDASTETVKEIASFVKSANSVESNGKLRTGLIMTGPDNSTTSSLFESLAESLDLEGRTILHLKILTSEMKPSSMSPKMYDASITTSKFSVTMFKAIPSLKCCSHFKIVKLSKESF